MLMKGARQSSSLPEVGKSRGKEERTAARKKRGVGQARLGEPHGGLLGFTLPHCQPCICSWCSCEERERCCYLPGNICSILGRGAEVAGYHIEEGEDAGHSTAKKVFGF